MIGKRRGSRNHFILNSILFGLGMTSCFIFMQMLSTGEMNEPIAYSNPKEPALQPLTSTHRQSDSNQNNDHKQSSVSSHKKKDLKSEKELPKSTVGTPGPTLWVVTPTFYRPEQKPELTRLAQALLPVGDFVHWIVVEDTSKGTKSSFEELKKFLQRFPLTVTTLKSFPPPPKKNILGSPNGAGGRNSAIAWLRENAQEGVVYFADDDNSYDSSIFKQMQSTEKLTMWPVGLVTHVGLSSPIVKDGKVVGFYDGWKGGRKYPVDMAGFAINLQLFFDNPDAAFPWKAGYQEDKFLQSIEFSLDDIKPLANNCTEILVWHTRSVKNAWPKPNSPSGSGSDSDDANTNLEILFNQLPRRTRVRPKEC